MVLAQDLKMWHSFTRANVLWCPNKVHTGGGGGRGGGEREKEIVMDGYMLMNKKKKKKKKRCTLATEAHSNPGDMFVGHMHNALLTTKQNKTSQNAAFYRNYICVGHVNKQLFLSAPCPPTHTQMRQRESERKEL